METETKSEMSEANGAAEPVKTENIETKAPTTTVKPWIEAGFKSRAEWRASKKPESSESPKAKKPARKAVKASAAKKPAKKAKKAAKVKAATKSAKKPAKKAKKAAKVKAKGKGDKKHQYPVTAAEKRKAAERTAAFKKSLVKKEEPNKNELKVLRSVKVGGEINIDKLATKFSGSLAKRKSQVRNALRWVVAAKKFKKIDRGTYKRIA